MSQKNKNKNGRVQSDAKDKLSKVWHLKNIKILYLLCTNIYDKN